MEFDALTAGVKPGGLRSKNDIKLLLCYLLSSIDEGLTKEDLITVLQDNGLANYFEAASAFGELLSKENIRLLEGTSGLYTVTQSGRMISEQLDVSLPISVREQVLCAAVNLLSKKRLEQENAVTITKNDNGCQVEFHISGGEMDLMSFSLYVPDMMQAKLVKDNFQKDPQAVYSCMLALMTRNQDMIREILQTLS